MTLRGFQRTVDSRTKRKMMSGGVAASLLAASLVVCLGFLGGYFNPSNPFVPNNTPLVTINETVSTSFADYIPYDESFTINAPSYSLSPGLTNIVNIDRFPYLTNAEKDMIYRNGFVVSPQSEYDQIYEILERNWHYSIPSFVSVDAVLHAFHVTYDLALREAEYYTFWDLLGNLTASLLDDAYSTYITAPPGMWKNAALRNLAYFTIAAYLLDNTTEIKSEVISMVEPVLSMIESHDVMSDQWFMRYMEDFSQFTPRGHYTRNEVLSNYFLAMMWYGRVQFGLSGEYALDHTAQAILIALALTRQVSGLGMSITGYEVWDVLYEPTAFFVGSSDDLLPTEYLGLIAEVYGSSPSWAILQDTSLLQDFIDRAVDLRDPMILGSPTGDSEHLNLTKGMRFMGQRFIPDSYILWELVFDNVGTESEPRLMPKGLDVMAALGSERAWALLDDQKHYDRYVEQMEMLRNIMSNITGDEWAQNLYYLWLYSLLPLLQEPSEGYPLFMQNQAWVDKQLNTALASWTELRHDTILYAKQSYAVLTSAPGGTAAYVEPVPRVYARLASLCRMMISGLETRSLLSDLIRHKLSSFESLLLFFKAISIKELAGETLNSTERSKIMTAYITLESVTNLPSDSPLVSDADYYMSLVADAHTDPNSGQVLEEAVGDPMFIHVAVSVDGQVWLTRGGVFSYYEFTQPISNRLTDESWRDMLSQGLEPNYPEWTQSFIAGPSGLLFATAVLSKK